MEINARKSYFSALAHIAKCSRYKKRYPDSAEQWEAAKNGWRVSARFWRERMARPS